jgi:hypothetical protein
VQAELLRALFGNVTKPALGLTVMAGEMLADARTGKTGRHALVGLLLRWLRRLRWYWNVVSIVLKV